jgi:lysophospholipase L1-like esterase
MLIYIFIDYPNVRDHISYFSSLFIPFEEMRLNSSKYKNQVDTFQKQNAYLHEPVTVFLGDSFTAGLDVSLFKREDIENRGIKGDTTVGILRRLNVNLHNIPVQEVFLMIGGNDLKFRNNDEIVKNIVAITQHISSDHIYVQSLFPLHARRRWFNKRIRSLNNRLEMIFIANEKVTYLNIYPYFEGRKKGNKIYLTRDGTHLNDRGNALWVHLLMNSLNE